MSATPHQLVEVVRASLTSDQFINYQMYLSALIYSVIDNIQNGHPKDIRNAVNTYFGINLKVTEVRTVLKDLEADDNAWSAMKTVMGYKNNQRCYYNSQDINTRIDSLLELLGVEDSDSEESSEESNDPICEVCQRVDLYELTSFDGVKVCHLCVDDIDPT
jgi:hypothetical protein